MKLKVGDYVRTNTLRSNYVKIYKVTEVGKARAKAVEVGNFPGLVFEGKNEIAFTLKTGKVLGSYSDRVIEASEGLEFWQNHNQEEKDEIDAKNADRQKVWQAKLDRAKALNPVFNFVEIEMGLKKVEVRLAENVSNLLFISVKPYEDHYGDNRVEVDFAAFGQSWRSHHVEFHHNNAVHAVSLEEALYDYIANNLIERKEL